MSRKAEMSMALIVEIVIGLVIMAIVIYMVWGKSKDLNASTSCDSSVCTANPALTKGCSGLSGGHYVQSFTTCKYDDKGKVKTGFCCVKDEI